ncbi:hypothetical protein [Nocardioides sp.]|uniref:hypothetical protein n=1 Tax=Nocardioides sp. TaxID=35761 RepID=UPI0034DEAF9C
MRFKFKVPSGDSGFYIRTMFKEPDEAHGMQVQVEGVGQRRAAEHPRVIRADLGDRDHLRPPGPVVLQVDEHGARPRRRGRHDPGVAEGVMTGGGHVAIVGRDR